MAKGIALGSRRARCCRSEEGGELVSALILARKRRIGPFRKAASDQNRELGVLARAGFPRDVALRALAMAPEEAEETIRVAHGCAPPPAGHDTQGMVGLSLGLSAMTTRSRYPNHTSPHVPCLGRWS